MRHKTLLGVLLCASQLLLLHHDAAAKGDDAKVKAAEAAAKSWLALVDSGKYAASYDEAAELFKKAVTKAKWLEMVDSVRKPLGVLVSRKLKGAKYATSLPGAPDGEYVVIQFDASYKSKKSAVETVTPMLDKDKKWRVSGYYIK